MNKTFRHNNTTPLPKRMRLEAYDIGSNRVPRPSPVLLVDKKNRMSYLVDPRYIGQILEREQARKPKRNQFKRMKNGA